MITFLPIPDFAGSVAMLDSKRLGNQRVEARMILRWLRNPKDYPRHQNAGYTIMWKGYEEALCLYYNACCDEWARRGGQNIVCQPEPVAAASSVKLPPWLGDDKLHQTHRSALLYKHSDHYEKFGWKSEISDPKVDYLWPRPVEGKEDEYELCPPAFWKKKKSSATKVSPAMTKPAAKEKSKRGHKKSTIKKKQNDLKEQKRYPSRRPRRSPRFANK
mmetsp:Transcript_22687/g.40599  ORF Transcript_22687/g.40599 Transcript_22687/m.40599 type:complete len:217 (+) Transcript_22687:70-720(+)